MTPTFRGFDSYVGYYGGGEDYYTHSSGGAFDYHIDECPNCGENCSRPKWEDMGLYSTHLFTARAEKQIAAHDPKRRLFLYLAYQAVHCPNEVPASYIVPYAHLPEPRRTFAGMLSALDEGIANVTASLKAKGLWENTILCVCVCSSSPSSSSSSSSSSSLTSPISPLLPSTSLPLSRGLKGFKQITVHQHPRAAAPRGDRTIR